MLYSKFVDTYIGKKIDFDGKYGVQCVDLINQYMMDVLVLKITYFPQYAKHFWIERSKSSFLIKNFTFLAPTAKLQRGDIGVRISGTAGHIFIIDRKINNKIYVYDQNNTGKGEGMTARVFDCNSKYITGVLRPKNQKNIDKGGDNVVTLKLKESPCKMFKTNAYLTSDTWATSDNTAKTETGFIYKNEKVKVLGKGEKNTIIQYGVNATTYKVGIVPTKLIKLL